MMEKDEDIFDIWANQIVATHSIRKDQRQPLARTIARRMRHVHENAQEEIRSQLRTLLDVPSTDDLIEKIDDHGY